MPATVFVGDIPDDTRRSDIEHFVEKSKYGRGKTILFFENFKMFLKLILIITILYVNKNHLGLESKLYLR